MLLLECDTQDSLTPIPLAPLFLSNPFFFYHHSHKHKHSELSFKSSSSALPELHIKLLPALLTVSFFFCSSSTPFVYQFCNSFWNFLILIFCEFILYVFFFFFYEKFTEYSVTLNVILEGHEIATCCIV